MVQWIKNKKNQQSLATVFGIFPNIAALYFIDQDLFFYFADKPLLLVTFFVLFLVLMGLIENAGKIFGKAVFILSITTITVLFVKLIMSFLIDLRYIQW